MFNPKMYKELCILCCAVQHITGLAEKSFVKVRVPDGHFIPSEGQPRPLHGPKTDCAFNCAMDGECEAYLVEGNLCSTGVMNMSNPYVPSFVSAGKNVMVETHKVFFNTFSIPFSGHLEAVESTGKALTNGTILSPLTFKPYPYKATGKKVFGNTGYKGGLIVCGGLNNGVTVKTCSFWTFASAKWTMMEGELANGHFAGRLVVVQDRLWMFMGSQDEAGAPYKKVESYDLKLGRWREEPDANVVYGAQYFEAVVFDQTKVLLVCGRRKTDGTKNPASYVFDTIAGTYVRTSNPYGGAGRSHMGCGIKPWDTTTILCAAGSFFNGGSNARTVKEFDTVAEEWKTVALPPPPTGGNANLVVSGGEVYLITAHGAYRYQEGGSPAWAAVDTEMRYQPDDKQIEFTLAYHEILN